ncbi:MAG: M20/M25/M40 family metallo-hydrolase [Eubacteriales bacterium]|nr:M20/M25/M40 family metallo-hydrolase [Eubacteriales bacterium]
MNRTYLLDRFEPRDVLRHFEDICAIPHGTGHEAALRAHIEALAEKNGLPAERDEAGNLLVRVPASAGCEAAPPFLIQGHMDMVLAKEPWVERDLEREPVELVLEGNVLRANGTTLGADNAVGLCHMLALMEPSELRHPPLELLFTVEEESGMTGIRKADLSGIRSRRMLNMDCGDPDCLVIGAGGGSKYDLYGQFPLFPAHGFGLCVEISGLRGGHSGIEAGKNRASALELAGRLLSALCDRMPVRLLSLDSPPAANSFPRWMKITLSVSAEDLEEAEKLLARSDCAFQRELSCFEPDYRMTVTVCEITSAAASEEDTRRIADFLQLVPFDALRRAPENPAWVLCSALLSRASFTAGVFRGYFSVRANRDPYRDAVEGRLRTLCRMTGIAASPRSAPTPAWVEKEDSPLRDLCLSLYRELFGEEMRVQVENGSVEVGVILDAVPGMDAVGFAPKSRGAHTTDEYLDLESMPPFRTLFTALLSRLCDT